jgi:hypothetical protein
MDFRPWIGVILASVVNVLFYSNLIPVYTVVRTMIFADEVYKAAIFPSNLMASLDAVLYWGPLIVLIGGILYAIIATIIPQESDTWAAQARRYQR